MEYVKPQATDDYGWDPRLYERGNVHIEGFYNPIGINAKNAEQSSDVELLPSENYKAALVANEVIPKAMNPEPFDKIRKMVMAGAAASGLCVFLVVVLFTQV